MITGESIMYTIKGLIDPNGQAAIFETAHDRQDAITKVTKLRKLGHVVEIWDEHGNLVPEREIS
jgi:hypothetical protein